MKVQVQSTPCHSERSEESMEILRRRAPQNDRQWCGPVNFL